MVRLKASMPSKIWWRFIYFNSSMVRLKVSQLRSSTTSSWFQFQYGAIEGFNGLFSRADGGNISIPVWCDWRHIAYQTLALQYIDFNSSMVRLKEDFVYNGVRGRFEISIPVWCDWRKPGMLPLFKSTAISIPVWCDWRKPGMLPLFKSTAISIPVWCDWRHPVVGAVVPLELYFNSSMVRLKASWMIAIKGSRNYFNSSMVRLKGGRNFGILDFYWFQFQYGAIEG